MTSAEPIDVVRRINDAFVSAPFEQVRAVTRDADGFDDGIERLGRVGLAELTALDELIADEVVVGETDIEGAASLTEGVGRGKDAWWSFFRAWFEPWAEFELEMIEYVRRGHGGVLADCRVRTRGEMSGVPTEVRLTQLWVVHGGKVTRYGIFSTLDVATAALERGAPQP